jgi:hypothetical protein
MKLKQLLFALTFLFGFGIASLAQMTSLKKDRPDIQFVICAEMIELEVSNEQLERIDPENFLFLSYDKEKDFEHKVMKVKMTKEGQIDDIDPNLIQRISVYKRKRDLRKFDAKDSAGVVEIYLKSEKDFWHLITQ